MSENFELLDIGQIEIMHDQVHDRLGIDEADCGELRMQHDSLAAELVKRGLPHDTEIICPESELAQKAPNYRRGFTDEICTQCAFGQLFPFCNLYKADYVRGDTCDSFRWFEVLELEPPHGFLIANGKQTAWATPEKTAIKRKLIVSGGEVFGIAELDSEPVQMKTKDFDSEEWLEQHRITPRERRQWWPDNDAFYVYRLKNWHPYEGIKLYEDGKVIDEPKLSAKQWKLISKSRELPKQITLLSDAVSITDKQEFLIFPDAQCDYLKDVLAATYEVDVKEANEKWSEKIHIYSLALVRNPRMRVSKKNLIAEAVKEEKQEEGEAMPFAVRLIDGEYCVINTDTDESRGCHETREEANAQLAALRINVEEDENSAHPVKPRKKKDIIKGLDKIIQTGITEKPKKPTFMGNLRSLGKSIQDLLKSAENEENKGSLIVSEVGIGQKLVNGELWHFTYSTNAFEDREGEIFSTKSLESYVLENEKKDHRGYFNLWHINAENGNFCTDFAEKKWQAVLGRFLVEAGPYLNNSLGRSAKVFFSKFSDGHPELAPEGWGCSPEFRYLPEERETGVYENIWITRTSTLPKMAAANIWTDTRQLARSKNMTISESQLKMAIAAFGQDEIDLLIAEAEKRTAELEERVAHKDKKEKSKPQEIQLNMEDLAAEVGKQFQINLTPMAEAMTTMAASLKEIEGRLEKVEENKQVEDKTETSRFVFNMQRASEDKKTIVTDDDGLKNQKPNEAKAEGNDPWGQMFNK